MTGVKVAELVGFDGVPIKANADRRLHYAGDLIEAVGEVKGPTTLSRDDWLTIVRVETDGEGSLVEFAHGIRCTSCGVLLRIEGGTGGPGQPLLTGSTQVDRRAWCGDCASTWRAEA